MLRKVWGYTTKLRGHKAQWERFAQCFRELEKHVAPYGGISARYLWLVRTRFDTVFFGAVPPMRNLSLAAVHAPARKVGGDVARHYGLSRDDVWSYAGEPCSNDNACFISSSAGAEVQGGSESPPACLLLTDQFAYIPARRAADYFITVGEQQSMSLPAQPRPTIPDEYVLVEGHTHCEWPEGTPQ
eukprot:SAG11_NODE_5363_length_1582_cov_1.209036_1_plen_186_part_00